jgi:hypothetical protein
LNPGAAKRQPIVALIEGKSPALSKTFDLLSFFGEE